MRQFLRRQYPFSCIGVALLAIGVYFPAFSGQPSEVASYAADPADSYFLAVTGKAGIFGFAGHNHAVLAKKWSIDESIDPSNLANSSVTVTIPVSSLVIDSAEARRLAELDSGPSEEDVRKIQQTMLGPDVLDAERYPTIQFTTTSVEVRDGNEMLLTGQVRMHGQAHEVRAPVQYRKSSVGGLSVLGQFTLKQTDFGIRPSSVGMGTVKVKNEVQIRFQVSLAPSLSRRR